MAILSAPLKIVHYPHPALRHPAKPLTSVDAKVCRIAEQMLELMYQAKGLGLAAPQVGLPFALFVANFAGDPEQPEKQGVFLNPVIHDRQGSVEAEEGCLSFPGLYRKVRRARSVRVQAYRLEPKTGAVDLVEIELSEMAARIWQHESDHLEGKLFIDKVGMIGKMTLGGPLDEFERDYRKAQKRGDIPPNEEIEKFLADLDRDGPPEIPPQGPPPCVL